MLQSIIRAARLQVWPRLGYAVGEWQTDCPAYRDGELMAWRLDANGAYQYRKLTDAEATEHSRSMAW